MIMKSYSTLVVLGVSLLLPFAAWAQRSNPNAVEQLPNPFIGTVVSTTANSVIVKGDIPQDSKNPNASKSSAKRINFIIRTDSKLTREGQPAKLVDIKKDEPIAVSFTCKEGSSLRKVTDVVVGKGAESVQAAPKPAEEEKDKDKKDKKGKADKAKE